MKIRELQSAARKRLAVAVLAEEQSIIGLEVDLLLAKVLGCQREALFIRADESLTDCQLKEISVLLNRRIRGEPLAYILGAKEFYGYVFELSSDVLIPRPETEFLVSRALELLDELEGKTLIVDVGTGSGAIAVSIAAEIHRSHEKPTTKIKIIAADRSYRALKIAKKNAERLGVSGLISFVCGNLLSWCNPSSFQNLLILANLPYIPENDKLPKSVMFEPCLALRGGCDGLELIRQLVRQVAVVGNLVNKGKTSNALIRCKLLLEIGLGQDNEIESFLSAEGFIGVKFIRDYQNIPRIVEAEKESA